jgi:prolyl oligopeptidase
LSRFAIIVVLALAGLPSRAQWHYPPTRTVDVTDTYFGKAYPDPLRWLENLPDQDVQTWFKDQANLTDGLLAKIPGKDGLFREWMALDKLQSATYSSISGEKGRVFFKKTLGGENVGRLFCREGWNGPDQLLFDPAGYKPGVTSTIEDFIPSFDGRYVAIGFSAGGAEYSEIRVLDVARRVLLPERIYPSYGPIGWSLDNRSFFYDAGRVTDLKAMDIELNRKTRIHQLGAEVAQDQDCFSNESAPELGITAKERPVAYVRKTCPEYVFGRVFTVQNDLRLFYAPATELAKGKVRWKVLCAPADHLVRGLSVCGDQVYAVTYDGAPRFKLVRTSVKEPDWKHAETVLPEAADLIQSLTRTRDYLFLVYSNGITGRVVKFDPATGKASAVVLPASGTVGLSCPDTGSNRCLVSITSWTAPVTLYDLDGDQATLVKSSFDTAVAYPGFESLVAEEVEAPSYDGTLVPLSIIHQRGMPLDGSSNCILQGYGAYGSGARPRFSVLHSIALHGVVFAYAHPRGGDEKGEAWYKAGFQATKPNTWKDYIACAEYLVKHGYTSPQRLGGTGTSAGGILISRATTERPDLFGAAVCNVGCANAMRLEFSANGPVNTPEFGSVQDSAGCQALYEMDGVQHVQPGVKYPAILGVAGWNDPRVAPWQPGKFVAALQRASASGKPVLMKVNYDSGHFTEEKQVTFNNFASQYAFLLWQTGHKGFQPSE